MTQSLNWQKNSSAGKRLRTCEMSVECAAIYRPTRATCRKEFLRKFINAHPVYKLSASEQPEGTYTLFTRA
jgi:hypothetical protein